MFEQVDGHLSRVDRYRAKVERRVADTVRYLDRSQPGMATKIAGMLQRLAPHVTEVSDGDESLVELPIIDVLPVGTQSLRQAPRHRQPPEPRPLRIHQVDPAVQARQKALRAYLDRRRIDPKRIAEYLERHLNSRSSIDGDSMTINGVEDFIAFTHLRHLEYLPGADRLRCRYRIESSNGWIDNDWVRCPAFVVHMRDSSPDSEDPTRAA